MIELTEEQRLAVLNGQVVRVAAPEVGGEIVLLRADAYEEIRELLKDEQERKAWSQLSRKATERWAHENPY
jgi:hypothetical protein